MNNPVLPNAQLSIIHRRPKVSAKPDELKTLGDHIRRRRKALRLPQREVAARSRHRAISVLNGRTTMLSRRFVSCRPSLRSWATIRARLCAPETKPANAENGQAGGAGRGVGSRFVNI